MSATAQQFASLWDLLGCRGYHLPIFELIASCYREPPCAYHTLEHIGWGLKRIDEIAATEPTCDVKAVKWAMWFHDARINFDDDRDLDELDSATMAAGQAISAMLARGFCEKLRKLVLATAHTEAAKGIDELSFLKAAEQLQQSTTLTVTAAVMDWSAKCTMTPEQWLEIYTLEVTLTPWQPGEYSLTLKLVVTAKARAGVAALKEPA